TLRSPAWPGDSDRTVRTSMARGPDVTQWAGIGYPQIFTNVLIGTSSVARGHHPCVATPGRHGEPKTSALGQGAGHQNVAPPANAPGATTRGAPAFVCR